MIYFRQFYKILDIVRETRTQTDPVRTMYEPINCNEEFLRVDTLEADIKIIEVTKAEEDTSCLDS